MNGLLLAFPQHYTYTTSLVSHIISIGNSSQEQQIWVLLLIFSLSPQTISNNQPQIQILPLFQATYTLDFLSLRIPWWTFYKIAHIRETIYTFNWYWGGSFCITSIFSLSTSISFCYTLWPRTMPSLTKKWHFFLFSTNFVSLHLAKTCPNFEDTSNEIPSTKKSFINTLAKSTTAS